VRVALAMSDLRVADDVREALLAAASLRHPFHFDEEWGWAMDPAMYPYEDDNLNTFRKAVYAYVRYLRRERKEKNVVG